MFPQFPLSVNFVNTLCGVLRGARTHLDFVSSLTTLGALQHEITHKRDQDGEEAADVEDENDALYQWQLFGEVGVE